MTPDVGLAVLEAYGYFFGLLGLILIGIGLLGWWRMP